LFAASTKQKLKKNIQRTIYTAGINLQFFSSLSTKYFF